MQLLNQFLSYFDKYESLLTILAVTISPLIAVQVTRVLDKRKEQRDRKFLIFTALMRTRQSRLASDHVGALNLTEVEFYGNEGVLTKYRAYIEHLNSTFPTDNALIPQFITQRNDKFTEFMSEMAKSLGYQFDKRDLERLGYLPIATANHEENSMANAGYMREVLEGKRPFPITNFVQGGGIFPPSPTSENK